MPEPIDAHEDDAPYAAEAAAETARARALAGNALIAAGALIFVATALALMWLLGEP